MAKIIKIQHVAMLVKDIDQSLAFWKDALGLTLENVQDVPEQEAKVAFLPIGEGEVELVQPVSEESGLARFLEKKGAGMHHICIQVEGITELLDELNQKGIRLINNVPLSRDDGKAYAFIHPASTGGVLVELYELPE